MTTVPDAPEPTFPPDPVPCWVCHVVAPPHPRVALHPGPDGDAVPVCGDCAKAVWPMSHREAS